MNELVEAADDKILAKTIARYGRVDLLCIDELGYDSFGGWTKSFTEPRLTFGGNIIDTGSHLAHTKAHQVPS